MHNITLIGTAHTEKGLCNPDELYKILQEINPNVIFDELSSNAACMFYGDCFDPFSCNSILLNQRPPVPLEVKSIRKYKQNYNVEIIPVDTIVGQSPHNKEFLLMFHTFFNCEDYKKLDNEKEILIAQNGFPYLNSDDFLDLLKRKTIMELNIIESSPKKDRLLEIYRLFQEEQVDRREKEMLWNIYNYSKEHQYSASVFLIGAEHTRSIMSKISEYEKISETNLSWNLYGNKSYFIAGIG